jgi:hypothetical protein
MQKEAHELAFLAGLIVEEKEGCIDLLERSYQAARSSLGNVSEFSD